MLNDIEKAKKAKRASEIFLNIILEKIYNMRIKTITAIMGFLIGMIGFLVFANSVFADDYGLSATAGAAGLSTSSDVPTLMGNIVGAGLSLISVIFFALMIYGGILWMTAHGNEEGAKKGRETIIAAVIGIIIVLSAYAVTNFVFKSASSGGGGGGGDTKVACMIGNVELTDIQCSERDTKRACETEGVSMPSISACNQCVAQHKNEILSCVTEGITEGGSNQLGVAAECVSNLCPDQL